MTDQVLLRTQGVPERVVPAGADALDGLGHGLGVLVAGRLQVSVGDVALARLHVPGSFVGELGALLGTQLPSQVTAVEPATLRVLADPASFFRANPDLRYELGRQLASRLYVFSAYLPEQRQPLVRPSS